MISDQILIDAIDKSPLSASDKSHWKKLLPKFNLDQRERFHHSITSKTEIRRVINLIERALNIIAEAESEAEKEVRKEEKTQSEKEELLKELSAIKNKEEEILMDEETLKKKQQETNDQINQIRESLRRLSLEVHGQPPPSYSQTPPPKIPQIKR